VLISEIIFEQKTTNVVLLFVVSLTDCVGYKSICQIVFTESVSIFPYESTALLVLFIFLNMIG